MAKKISTLWMSIAANWNQAMKETVDKNKIKNNN